MWRAWKIIDPRTVLLSLIVFLSGMAFFLHFLAFNADRFYWLKDVVHDASHSTQTAAATAAPAPAPAASHD
ncbi:light-harvesting protein [Rhodocyclus tenuis]|uniref:Light-harvesting protein n=1 Tax=Rhodocyclus gracilis TaxID=2929842 RepID=A0ABX0WLC1_9RHOO|nr:light-harvesting antenna LH1, alpha subunit [Rhodocyclus gracilis]MRD73930.1 light-harvesting protein [Rhodocyclus gracilis]NJA90095.1 light-harvesting protein [Rhodocyclus gracilis]